jgi:hypothetical protein
MSFSTAHELYNLMGSFTYQNKALNVMNVVVVGVVECLLEVLVQKIWTRMSWLHGGFHKTIYHPVGICQLLTKQLYAIILTSE